MEIKEDLLRRLAEKRQGIWELAKTTEYSMLEIVRALNELYEKGKVDSNGQELWALDRKKTPAVNWGKVEERFCAVEAKRPELKDSFDQNEMCTRSALERARVFAKKRDMEGARMLFIGDDDLVGMACSLTGLPKEVVVLEIDKTLVDFINAQAKEKRLPLKAVQYNVEEPIPKKMGGKFDFFHTESVETLPGIRLFLARGIEALKTGGTMYFGLTHMMSSLAKWKKIQEYVLKSGMVITNIWENHSEYQETEKEIKRQYPKYRVFSIARFPLEIPKSTSSWFYSSLVRCKAMNPRPMEKGKKALGKRMFRDSEQIINTA